MEACHLQYIQIAFSLEGRKAKSDLMSTVLSRFREEGTS